MAIFKRAASLNQDEYQEAIDKGLGRAFEEAERHDVQLSELRIVVFSDLHRGARDGADDFQRCEPAYSAALGSYLSAATSCGCSATSTSCGRTTSTRSCPPTRT